MLICADIEYPISENRYSMWFDWSRRRHRGLRWWVLYNIESSPKNGAEIMDGMEAMTQGWWRPSPGSIYPLLDSMVKEGEISKREDGRYELTQKGKEEVGWVPGRHYTQPRTVQDVLVEMTSYTSYLEDLAKSDVSKLSPYIDQIRALQARLSKLSGA